MAHQQENRGALPLESAPIIFGIVAVAAAVAYPVAGLGIAHHPPGEVVIISGGDARFRIRGGGQAALVIIAVVYIRTVLVGLTGHTPPIVIAIVYPIPRSRSYCLG